MNMVPYTGTSTMKLWPALADCARMLRLPSGDDLFFYDTGAAGTEPSTTAEAAGKPPLLLIHGLGDEADSWRHIIPLLRESFRVLAVDLPGFGRSTARSRAGTGRHVAALQALLGIVASDSRPAVLAGNSLGAMIAQRLAYTRPGLVRDLVLLDGAFPAALPFSPALLLVLIPGIGSRSYRRFRRDHEGAWRSLYPYYADLDALGREDREFLRERVVARVESRSQEKAYFESFRSLILTQFRGRARMEAELRAWCRNGGRGGAALHILWGAADRIMPAASAALLRSICPEAEFAIIPGAGHLPHQEKPEETAEFLLRLRGRGD